MPTCQSGRKVCTGEAFCWLHFHHQTPPVREQSCPAAMHIPNLTSTKPLEIQGASSYLVEDWQSNFFYFYGGKRILKWWSTIHQNHLKALDVSCDNNIVLAASLEYLSSRYLLHFAELSFCFSLGCLSLPNRKLGEGAMWEAEMYATSTLLWEPTAFHITPKEMRNLLWPNKDPWKST